MSTLPTPEGGPSLRSPHHAAPKSDMVRKNFFCQVKGIDLKNHTITVVVTTESLDRDNEIILASALDQLLYIFEENPILLWGHKQRGEPEDALGHAVKFVRLADGWEVTFRYSVEVNPKAQKVFDLVVDGTLRAYSIGFIPHAWVTSRSPADALSTLPAHARELLQIGVCKTVYTLVEVVEISNVLIGSNRDAIRRAAAKGLVGADYFEEEPMQNEKPGTPHVKSVETPAATEPATTPVAKALEAPAAEQVPEPEVRKKMHPVTADICTRLRTVADNLEGYLDPDYWWRTSEEVNAPPKASIVAGAKAIVQAVADQLGALEQESTEAAVASAVVMGAPAAQVKAPTAQAKAPEAAEPAPAPVEPAAAAGPETKVPDITDADVLGEAAAIALRAIEDAYRAKGVDPATIPEDELATMVAEMLSE